MVRSTVAHVDLAAVQANYRAITDFLAWRPEGAPPRRAPRIIAVVKANAYGHGAAPVGLALEQAGAQMLACADIEEALVLRAAGVRAAILVFGALSVSDLGGIFEHDLVPTISTPTAARAVEAEAARRGVTIGYHLKIDTGMHRLGFAPGRAHEVHARLRALPGVDRDVALMTHFANSDVFDDAATARQIECFERATARLEGERSLSNSAGVLGWPEAQGQWIRVGGALYGISVVAGRIGADFGFRPAMTLSTRLIAVKRVARGEAIGYGGTFVCPEDMAVGVAAIGYGDGYPRHASARTAVLLRGRLAPVIGRVSMDLVTLDLRAHADAEVGDTVVLWGRGLPVEHVAAAADTIGYELVCGMTRRVSFVDDEAPLP